MKNCNKRFIIYLTLSFLLSLITVYYAYNSLSYPKLFIEGIIYYSIIIFLNDSIIRWFYLRTNIPSFIKILINIFIGLSLLVIGRFLVSPFELFKLLNFDLFIVFLFPIIIISDVNLDFYFRKSFEKYNMSLKEFRNKKH